MKKVRFFDGAWLFLLALLLAAGGTALWFFPADRFSAAENRWLAERPAFSPKDLADGTYTAGWETYTSERLPGRQLLREIRAVAELAQGKREVNGVVIGKNGSLLRRHTVNKTATATNLRVLRHLQKQAEQVELPLTVAVAPRRIDVCEAQLPRLYHAEREQECCRALQEALPESLLLSGFLPEEWFRTDHHWTAAGAYRAYVGLSTQLGFAPAPLAAFTTQTVSKSFYGTTAAAAGLPGISADCITLMRYEGDEDFLIKTNGKPAPFAGFYDMERLQTNDGYGVFLGGNYGTLTVDLGETDTRPRLLLIKDSFANALIPFLARHYRVTAIDPRYGSPDMAQLLQEADQVLVLCGIQTLTEVPVLAPLLR